MNLRLALSRLERTDARDAAARTLAVLCAAGYIVTLAVLVATGVGLRRWLFALLVWALFIYLPMRILLEAFQTIAPALRRSLVARASIDPARYGSRTSIELIVDGLFEAQVLMPRIATPLQSLKAKEASAAVLRAANRTPRVDLSAVALRCLGAAERWTADLSGWAQSEAKQNIQIRWAGLRSLASFVAMCRVLTAAVADQTGRQMLRRSAEYLDACLDYCDQLALEVDVEPWNEPPLEIQMNDDDAAAIRLAWTAYADTPPPAIDARNTFVKTLINTATGQRDNGTTQ